MTIRPGDKEGNRGFDISIECARYIVDTCAKKYWKHTNYLNLKNRPYISFFLPATGAYDTKQNEFKTYFDELRKYSKNTYNIDPYMVGIISHASPIEDSLKIKELGLDALSGYANLLSFPQAEPVMDYENLVVERVHEWKKIIKNSNIPVEPTAMVGFDVSPRCVFTDSNGDDFVPDCVEQLKPFTGEYPHRCIAINCSAASFGKMLQDMIDMVKGEYIPEAEKIITIMAWNEMSEGSCMLPRIMSDGTIDKSYINVCKETIQRLHNAE